MVVAGWLSAFVVVCAKRDGGQRYVQIKSEDCAGLNTFLLLPAQALKDPAPFADQLVSVENRSYQRVSMEEARKGTPRETLSYTTHVAPITSLGRIEMLTMFKNVLEMLKKY